MSDPLSLNLYTYCHNNPVFYTDPTGHIVQPFLVVAGLVGFAVGAIVGGIPSAIQGKFSWEAVVQGAAIGSTVGLTGGAGLSYGVTGNALASTGAVASGLEFGAATVGPTGATGFEQTRQLLQAQQMRAVEGAGSANINKALETAQQAHKGGESLAGHALQKHAGRNPNIWGIVKGGAEQINRQAMKHIDDIINGSGEFKIFTTDRGVQFWEKMLLDGRGLRLNLDGTFKGFIDQIK